MALARFLRTLQVDGADSAPPGEEQTLADALRAMDTAVRLDRPEELPGFDLASAEWATKQLYAICLALQQGQSGDIAPGNPVPAGQQSCPGAYQDPATHFSVDLALRHLPTVFTPASTLAKEDPRREALLQLAHDWPLSSVGMAEVTAVDASVILSHDGLRRTYVERILRRRDESRRRNAGTEQAVAAVMAEHVAFANEVLAVHDALIQPRRQ